MKGKKPTAAQRRIISRGQPRVDVDEYLIKKIQVVEDGSKRLSKGGERREIYFLIHRDTQEMIQVECSSS